MKRFVPYAAFVAGLLVIAALVPRFNAAQPAGIRLTRGDAIPIADRAARQIGIPVDQAWSSISWYTSSRLSAVLERTPDLRRRANSDPVLAPRLGAYHRMYYRRGLEKYPSYGYTVVDPRSGAVLGARLKARNEEVGAKLAQQQIRPIADAFVRSRTFPGAPSPQFESARPYEFRSRTDWIVRYRVRTNFPIGNVVPYLYVYVVGDRFAGWELMEEYANGSAYRSETSEIAGIIARYAIFFTLLLILLVIFLRKYHAGEVGVETGSILFAVLIVLNIALDVIIGPASTEGSSTGGLDAQQTAFAYMVFKFLLYDLVVAVLVFFAWSVGESYARERWGERLASFEAVLKRHLFNATVGRSLLIGILCAPAVAAAALVSGIIPVALQIAHVSGGLGTDAQLDLGGPPVVLLFSICDAIIFPVLALFLLSWTDRRRLLWIGILATIAV